MMIRDVLLVVVTMALFLFALQPREDAHVGRRREADRVADDKGVVAIDHIDIAAQVVAVSRRLIVVVSNQAAFCEPCDELLPVLAHVSALMR